ncbi:hypothetical protein RYX36_029840 [Vicia faba]
MVASEVVSDAGVNMEVELLAEGCLTKDMDFEDHATEEGFSTEEPPTFRATPGNTFDHMFNSNMNSSPLMRKSPTPSSSDSDHTFFTPPSNNLTMLNYKHSFSPLNLQPL